jgi:hypothetical protein
MPAAATAGEAPNLNTAIAQVAKQNNPAVVQIVSTLQPGREVTLVAMDHRSGRSGYIQVVVR